MEGINAGSLGVKTFKSDGKWRQMHEQSHDPPVYIEEQPMLAEVYSSNDVSDDMYNYQIAFLDYGMVVMNFLDAISEGDGERVIRSWKFLLLYFQNDKGSPKYGLSIYVSRTNVPFFDPSLQLNQSSKNGTFVRET